MSLANSIFKVLQREAGRIVRRRSYMALLTLLPATAMTIFGALFLHPVTKLPIALLDDDNTTSSRQFARMVNATAGAEIRYSISSSHEGKELIRKGKAYAMIIIPQGFEGDILAGRPSMLALFNSGANLTTNGII